ncbi:LacI family DNA-binding transcriptional regulator [Alkalicoccobacillus murimartini]|uniref:LacI family transcriptional regulator n=1 Tax=Alkalicoccobacillus murimartini TaxID=171685 RepID=A0ABT9YIM4_9BACI|nr:LacI family DNA-binding transcriptional regulator [Alkalicoccobacillus murimartini]MDQ0207677.1 LacI family transcriptional regulator [Alkalicoccobacillus murimartini]
MVTLTKTTAKTIAEKLGLSIATVDRALNNRGNVKKETYQKIMDTVEELGYKPNKLASVLSKKMKYKMAVLYPAFGQYFWSQVEVGLNKAINELADYGVEVTTFRMKEGNDSDMLQKVIDTNEYHAIAVASGEEILDVVINDGIEKGVTICTFNQDALGSKRLFYVGADYYESGRLAAELTCKFVGQSGKVAVFGQNNDFQTNEKNRGFIEASTQYQNVQVYGPIAVSTPLTDKLKDLIEGLDGIYVSTSDIFEVAAYLSSIDKKLTLICHDLNEEIHHFLESGVITATINQDPVNQGYLTLMELFRHLAFEEEIKAEQITKLEVVMKENAKYYL